MKRLLFLLFLSTLAIESFCQLYEIRAGSTVLCPSNPATDVYGLWKQNADGTYSEVSGAGQWVVTNGTIITGDAKVLSSIGIRWIDGFDKGKVIAYNSSGGELARIEVFLLSIKHKTPEAIGGSTSIAYGQQSSTYSIATMKYSDGTEVENYSWIIPTGWSLDGVVSTGSNVYSGQGTSITVVTDNTTSGEIKVAGENTSCPDNSNSKYRPLSVDRFIPEFTITKGSTSNTFLQGDSKPIVLDAPNYSWATYSWTISGGGSLQQPTNQKSVTVLPNGCNCTVTCAIAAGGKSRSSNFPLIFNAEYPNNPATVNGSDVICSGNYTCSLNYLPPQATTQWSVSDNL